MKRFFHSAASSSFLLYVGRGPDSQGRIIAWGQGLHSEDTAHLPVAESQCQQKRPAVSRHRCRAQDRSMSASAGLNLILHRQYGRAKLEDLRREI